MVEVVSGKVAPAHAPNETRGITATVALMAAAVFVVSGSQVLTVALFGSGQGGEITPGQAAALILNIALLLLAWRRSSQLKQSFVQRDAADERIHRLANFDELTGLHNRRHLAEEIDRIAHDAAEEYALLLVGLDRFRDINAGHGHAVGDDVLKAVAARIVRVAGPDAVCARTGGDEFAIIARVSGEAGPSAGLLAAQVLSAIAEPVRTSAATFDTGASIGLVDLRDRGGNAADALKMADIALGRAKKRGGRTVIEFTDEMANELAVWSELEADMRKGIECGEFVPYFQPIVDLHTDRIRGFEVLARWRHPRFGLVNAGGFLDFAEKAGMIGELSLSVMEQALRVAIDWPADLKIAVNLSPQQFKDEMLAVRILKLLSATGFPPRRLELEVHERSLAEDYEHAKAVIESFRNNGIGIAIDDLGVSYASIAKLQSLPFDRIKIDRSFVAALEDSDKGAALVKAIATLGRELRMPIGAEGVQSRRVREMLMQLGCEDAQGGLFAMALSAEEALAGLAATAEVAEDNATEDDSLPEAGHPVDQRAVQRHVVERDVRCQFADRVVYASI